MKDPYNYKTLEIMYTHKIQDIIFYNNSQSLYESLYIESKIKIAI